MGRTVTRRLRIRSSTNCDSVGSIGVALLFRRILVSGLRGSLKKIIETTPSIERRKMESNRGGGLRWAYQRTARGDGDASRSVQHSLDADDSIMEKVIREDV